MEDNGLSIFGIKFWDLWLMKLMRIVASMKFISMTMVYTPIVLLMFSGSWQDGVWVSKLSSEIGVAAITGGLVTLILGRVYADTRLKQNGNGAITDEVSK